MPTEFEVTERIGLSRPGSWLSADDMREIESHFVPGGRHLEKLLCSECGHRFHRIQHTVVGCPACFSTGPHEQVS
jgi:hypothetical protein